MKSLIWIALALVTSTSFAQEPVEADTSDAHLQSSMRLFIEAQKMSGALETLPPGSVPTPALRLIRKLMESQKEAFQAMRSMLVETSASYLSLQGLLIASTVELHDAAQACSNFPADTLQKTLHDLELIQNELKTKAILIQESQLIP